MKFYNAETRMFPFNFFIATLLTLLNIKFLTWRYNKASQGATRIAVVIELFIKFCFAFKMISRRPGGSDAGIL